jgi:Tfp pilus assembly protein PilN
MEQQTNKQEAMFTIDLLNGQATPMKSRPAGLAIVAVTAVVPVTVALGMVHLYLNNNAALATIEQQIVRYEADAGKFTDAVIQQEALKKERIAYSKCLSEVSSSIKRHTQWSPVLTTLTESMPDSVVLTSLEVEHNSVKKKVPKKDDPQKTVDIDVLVRTLRLTVSGRSAGNCDEAVRDFRDRLRSSAFLGPKLENIGVSQKSETLEGRDVVSYEISCIFKPGF